MSSTKLYLLWGTLVTLSSIVNAHGVITQITAGGQQYTGYDPSKGGQQPTSDLVGWSTPENTDNGPIYPPKYSDPDIICHRGATPAMASVTVAAGETINLKWSTWPDSHHGPVIDYLASCDNGDCTTVDKGSLQFSKIAESGLIDGSSAPGVWGADELLQAGASWDVTIPSCVAPGDYVLRHEIIALHEAFNIGGAQNYPQCINLKVTGSGTSALGEGVPATQFYKDSDPGIVVGIYNPLPGYTIPGLPLWNCDGASEGAGTGDGNGDGMAPGMNATGVDDGYSSMNGTETTAGKCRRKRSRKSRAE
ncbi:MAG: hypothetical protein Q9169_006444 [Polycauliona sp. 2 TL-2023]